MKKSKEQIEYENLLELSKNYMPIKKNNHNRNQKKDLQFNKK